MRAYEAAADAPCLVLGHGAGAGEAHPWMVRVASGLAHRGVSVLTFNFPYIEARRRVPDRPPALEAAWRAAWQEGARRAQGPLFAGGKSMGGRMASQVAAAGGFDPAPVGLVFFGYPLHPPGKPHQRRDQHLPGLTYPLLFLSGSADPFGTPDEFRALMNQLPVADLEILDGGDHSLIAPKRQDPTGRLLEHALDTAASWITRVAGPPAAA